jgi:hypothetical protein
MAGWSSSHFGDREPTAHSVRSESGGSPPDLGSWHFDPALVTEVGVRSSPRDRRSPGSSWSTATLSSSVRPPSRCAPVSTGAAVGRLGGFAQRLRLGRCRVGPLSTAGTDHTCGGSCEGQATTVPGPHPCWVAGRPRQTPRCSPGAD